MEFLVTKKTTLFLLIIISFLFHYQANAQNQILQRKISIDAENKTVDEILEIVSKKGRFYFSYNSDIVPKNKLVPSLNLKNETIKNILEKILGDNIEPLESGKYIILRLRDKIKEEEDKPVENKPPEQKTRYTITGYIINAQTGERLTNATVYEIGKTNSVLTNMDGYYRLTVSTKADNLGLAYARRNFNDTVIVIQPANHSINMRLKPKETPPELIENKGLESLVKPSDQIQKLEELPLVKFAVKRRQFNLSKNLDFIEKQKFQVSLIPQVGTNRLMSGNVENNISLNVLGGYNYAVKGFELGGLLNIVRNDVSWFQISGFGNIVGGNTTGIQVAGFSNNNRKSVKGIQVSGFSNIVLDTITGVQLSGFSNVLKGRMNGLQLAGFSNVTTENVDGVQVSGFNNYARKDVRFAQLTGFANYGRNVGGVQIAGFANAGNDIGGAQIAGFANYAGGTVGGVQIAGFANIAKQVNSAQVSGFINVSTKEITGIQISTFNFGKKVKGFQIGLLNIADSVSGMSIGLLSFVKQGIHKFELALHENLYGSLSFKTGTHRFYNIFTTGRSLEHDELWTAGYGIGTEFHSKKRFYFGLDWLVSLVSEGIKDNAYVNGHFKFSPMFGWRLFKSSGIALSPSMNLFVSDWKDNEGNFLSKFAPYELFKIEQNGLKISGWIGGSVIIRF